MLTATVLTSDRECRSSQSHGDEGVATVVEMSFDGWRVVGGIGIGMAE